VRWNHPTRGLVPPDKFIPMAEATGRINDHGRWVLNAACHQGALWRAKYPALPGIQVGVNLSPEQLRQEDLVEQVAEALRIARLDPDGLTLEVTETALMEDFEVAAGRLGELKALGIEIAVDDFGVGHSSLRYLKGLPLDNLKIAKPFIDEIGAPDASPAILRVILELAEAFDLRTVAEGIEKPEQAQRLLELGCELGQGHLLAEPASVDVADDLILSFGLLGGPRQKGAEGDSETEEVSQSESAEGPAAAS
jgi:EAL domain-containing protein (putative c-di-GMP-specific phosphodiesterase class I)